MSNRKLQTITIPKSGLRQEKTITFRGNCYEQVRHTVLSKLGLKRLPYGVGKLIKNTIK